MSDGRFGSVLEFQKTEQVRPSKRCAIQRHGVRVAEPGGRMKLRRMESLSKFAPGVRRLGSLHHGETSRLNDGLQHWIERGNGHVRRNQRSGFVPTQRAPDSD